MHRLLHTSAVLSQKYVSAQEYAAQQHAQQVAHNPSAPAAQLIVDMRGPDVRVLNAGQLNTASDMAASLLKAPAEQKCAHQTEAEKYVCQPPFPHVLSVAWRVWLCCVVLCAMSSRTAILPELSYNLKMLVDMTEVDIHQVDRELRQLKPARGTPLLTRGIWLLLL